MRRLLLAVGGVAALLLGFAAPAAAANTTYTIHGVIYTTAVIPDDPSAQVHILTSTTQPSTLSHLGRVQLDQWQSVAPTAMQGEPPAVVPAAGMITLDAATITAADGSSTLVAEPDAHIPFEPDESVTAPNGWHPIKFSGTEVFAGTGRFAGFTATLHLTGGYCFYANAGFIVYDGTLTRS